MTPECREALRAVIRYRFMARRSHEAYNASRAALRAMERDRTKLAGRGISFALLDRRIDREREAGKALLALLQEYGGALMGLLDHWQRQGATLRDLCNLCNKPYEKALAEIGPDRITDDFSCLVFVHNLDYLHDDCGWIHPEVDAPMTHAIKEYMLHLMVTDPDAKQAASEAFEACFPDLAAKTFTMATTAEGETVFFDRNGDELDPADLCGE